MRVIYQLASTLTLTATMAGCGGAAAPETPSPPPPAGIVSLQFLNPSEANVFDQGSSSTLSVRATKDNGNADGIPVVFSANPGSVSPTSVLPVSGVATTTLSAPGTPVTGAMSITATAHATNAASATFSAYVRPVPDVLQVLVPAYFSASSNATTWTALTTGAQSYPDVQINIVVKPDNATSGVIPAGAYTPDASLITAIDALKTAHSNTKVLAYVATGGGTSGTISLADVRTTITQYATHYGPKIDGYFLDGMAAAPSIISSFYQPLATDIAGTTGLNTIPPLIVGNPATYPDKAYAGLVNVLVTHSGPASNYRNTDPQAVGASWVYDRKDHAQATWVHSASNCSDMQAAINRARSPRMNTGWIFVTDQTVGSPWSTLPGTTYWKSFLGTVDAINKGNPLPTC